MPHAEIEAALEERIERIKDWYNRQLSKRVKETFDDNFKMAVQTEVQRILTQAASISDREGRQLRVVDLDKPGES